MILHFIKNRQYTSVEKTSVTSFNAMILNMIMNTGMEWNVGT